MQALHFLNFDKTHRDYQNNTTTFQIFQIEKKKKTLHFLNGSQTDPKPSSSLFRIKISSSLFIKPKKIKRQSEQGIIKRKKQFTAEEKNNSTASFSSEEWSDLESRVVVWWL